MRGGDARVSDASSLPKVLEIRLRDDAGVATRPPSRRVQPAETRRREPEEEICHGSVPLARSNLICNMTCVGWINYIILYELVDRCITCVAPLALARISLRPVSHAGPDLKQEPVIKPQGQSKASGFRTLASAVNTTDGTCGAAHGGTTCGNWPDGTCCSQYGYCGKTTAHCGEGCQSGPCTNGPAPPGPSPAPAHNPTGSLRVNPSTTYAGKTVQAGVPAMHLGLLTNGKVFFLDKIENYTQVKLGNGQYAYSAEYDPVTFKVTPLSYKTNAFCCGGSFLPDGRVLSVGGNADLNWLDPTVGNGFNALRTLTAGDTAWQEPGDRKLNTNRWYASVCTQPDGKQFVASGSLNGLDPTKTENNNPTWEMVDRNGYSITGSKPMNILTSNQPYYMYPFIHLLKDGTMFIQVSKSAQIITPGVIKKRLPDVPGLYRTYPNTGTSVLLPLKSSDGYKSEVLICGGGSYQDITSPTDPSCARIDAISGTQWEMDSMPQGRGMVEGTYLADGTLVLANGCNFGAQGFGLAKNPTYQVLYYDSTKALGQRFSTGPTSSIARLYHSANVLLLDGTVMIAGSNPVEMPVLKPVYGKTPSEDYVTEFRIETLTPPYLAGDNINKRPTNVKFSTKSLKPAQTFTITFSGKGSGVKVSMIHGGFVTHSLHMNQRFVWLDNKGFNSGATTQTITVTMPPNYNIAPPMPYVIYVLVDGIPSVGQFVSVV